MRSTFAKDPTLSIDKYLVEL
jgi:hypothetical protein